MSAKREPISAYAGAILFGAMLGAVMTLISFALCGGKFASEKKRPGCTCCFKCECPLLGAKSPCKE